MTTKLHFQILTLFPEFFQDFKNHSIIARAIEKKIIEIEAIDIRDFSMNKHQKVDDTPFGGGAGMVMTCQPLWSALSYLSGNDPELSEEKHKTITEKYKIPNQTNPAPVIFMSPSPNHWNQELAEIFAQNQFPTKLDIDQKFTNQKIDRVVIICGHYEGIDQRVIDTWIDAKISIGPFVLTGGEIPAMIYIDSISRLLPGVLGNQESHEQESYSKAIGRNTIEHPHYTRPAEFKGLKVPDILNTGHHAKIEEWKKEKNQKIK